MIVLSEMLCVSGDLENQVELEEKTRLISQVLELQNTLEGKTTLQVSHGASQSQMVKLKAYSSIKRVFNMSHILLCNSTVQQ